jgi:DNA-binding transcriptional LysR family regulator
MQIMDVMNVDHVDEMDLNLLVALDALLGAGSVTEAARRCGVTQSAMSHSLARLRSLVGDPLLVRTHAGMAPTPRARALAQPLARALAELRSVVRTGTEFDAASSRRVFALASPDYSAFLLMPPLLERLGREAPGVEIISRPAPPSPAEPLEEERIDIALTPYPEPRSTLVAQKLFTERFVCVVRRGHPAVGKTQRKLDLATFTSLGHVQIAPRGSRGGVVDDQLAKLGKTRHVALRVADFLVAPAVVARSDLVLTLPARVARATAGPHGLRVLDPPFAVPGFSVYQVWHERRRHEPGHAWLRGVLAEVARSLDPA